MRPLTDTDSEWLVENLTWIHRVCLERWSSLSCTRFDKKHFPRSMALAKPTPDSLRLDLCSILSIDPTRVELATFTDARDISGMPLVLEGLPANSQLSVEEGVDVGNRYVIELANAVVQQPTVVLKELILRLSEVIAVECGAALEGPDLQQTAQLFSLYLGFAPIWSSSQGHVLYSTDGMWETKTRMLDPMPMPMLLIAIALVHALKPGSVDLDMISRELANEVRRSAPVFLDLIGPRFTRQWGAISHMRLGDSLQAQHRYAGAVEEYQRALFLADQEADLAIINNNIGYALVCKGDYEQSLSWFAQALKFESDFAYAMDNMGYAYVMIGDLNTAQTYLRAASRTEGNHPGYTLRNTALLLWKSGEVDAARVEFQKAIEGYDDVDLLEFHYARFLMERGEPEGARHFAGLSAMKGEPAGEELLRMLAELG